MASKPKKLRVISGPVAVVEQQLNQMFGDWIFQVWNFTEVNGELVMSVVAFDAAFIRQAMLAAGGGSNIIPR